MHARMPFIACTAALAVVAVLAVPSAFAQSAEGRSPDADETLLGLDFDLYIETVEPVFLARRPGNARCVACHSSGGGNAFLEPLPPGRETWDEEQSFRNFERVQRLVVPGAPTESALLVNPLVEEAGGSRWHAGGKHWDSQADDEWRALARWVNTTSVALDFGFYRDRVEPVFIARRPGNARCVACHSSGGGNAFLEPLPPGRETWDEEQSFRNFERVQRLVVPGAPTESVLLVNPLVEEAGGSRWHAGGKHWTTQDADEWQTLAAWVRGRMTP